MKLNLQQFAEPAPEAGAEEAEVQNPTDTGAGDASGADGNDKSALEAELEKLKATLADQKKALDEATHEAGKYRKELRAKQTAEEIAAEEKKAADEKAAQELEELRREVARAKTVKTVMGKLGTDEDMSGKIAEALYGADDIDNAMLLIQKAWAAKEKALRLEYGKLTGPGAGSGEGEDSAEQRAIELARKIGRERAEANKNADAGINRYLR